MDSHDSSSGDSESIFITQSTFREAKPVTFSSDDDMFISALYEFDEDEFLERFPFSGKRENTRLSEKRLGEVKTDADIQELIKNNIPINTKKKMNWAVNSFETWRGLRNDYTRKKPSCGLSIIYRATAEGHDQR